MRPEDRESLLSMLTDVIDHPPSGDMPVVTDERLEGYRRGTLSEADAAALEALLVAHPPLRRRLQSLAGVTAPPGPADIRARVLARAGTPHGQSDPSPSSMLRRWPWAAGLAAAAALALVVLRPAPPEPLPDRGPVPAYDVAIEALTVERGTPDGAAIASAFADTPVTVVATVAAQARDGVEVGLYRPRGRRLVRVDDQRGVTRDVRPGAVEIEIPAALLVGTVPGERPFFVAIAWRGDLPDKVTLDPDDDPLTALAEDGRRGVHRLTLRLLASRQASLSIDGGHTPDEETDHARRSTDLFRPRIAVHDGSRDDVHHLARGRHGHVVPSDVRRLPSGHDVSRSPAIV